MLKRKTSIQGHKKDAETRLAERVKTLQAKGMNETGIQRDTTVRHLKGEIRQAVKQLACITKLETENLQKAEAKAAKLTAAKPEQPKNKRPVDPAKKQARQERKMAATEEAEA